MIVGGKVVIVVVVIVVVVLVAMVLVVLRVSVVEHTKLVVGVVVSLVGLRPA